MPKRAALLAIFLTAAVLFMVVKTYLLWHKGPWDLPIPASVSSPAAASTPDVPAMQPRAANTDISSSKNLFDPERGAGQTKEVEASSRAMQRLRGLILLGTAILGENRYAIVQDTGLSAGAQAGAQTAGRPPQGQSSQTMRFKMGDTFEGFSLSQIQDKNVVFTNGAARVELALDYFRKVESAAPQVRPAAQAGPARPVAAGTPPGVAARRVIPQLPRRERLRQPPSS
ncbi:MAG TPA: hypothetical protein VJ646_02245 [Candidatus Binatia bacterium]|nr:hypothetical protein [Candidatus Binatia bacterium]